MPVFLKKIIIIIYYYFFAKLGTNYAITEDELGLGLLESEVEANNEDDKVVVAWWCLDEDGEECELLYNNDDTIGVWDEQDDWGSDLEGIQILTVASSEALASICGYFGFQETQFTVREWPTSFAIGSSFLMWKMYTLLSVS